MTIGPDAWAGGCAYWAESMGQDENKAMEQRKEEQLKAELALWQGGDEYLDGHPLAGRQLPEQALGRPQGPLADLVTSGTKPQDMVPMGFKCHHCRDPARYTVVITLEVACRGLKVAEANATGITS